MRRFIALSTSTPRTISIMILTLIVQAILGLTTWNQSVAAPKVAPKVAPKTNPKEESESDTTIRTKPASSDPWLESFWKVAKQVKDKRARRAIEQVLEDPQKYRFQLLITEYEKQKDGTEVLTPHRFRVDEEYFYPASTIKTYGSIAALRHFTLLRERHPWLTTNDPMSPNRRSCKKTDKSNEVSGLASLEHEIKKTQLISSNRAFNTVFGVTGFQRLHQYILPDFPSVRVYHRLSSRETHQESLRTPALHLCDWRKSMVNTKSSYKRPRQVVSGDLKPIISKLDPRAPTGFGDRRHTLKVGNAYKDMKTKKLIKAPHGLHL